MICPYFESRWVQLKPVSLYRSNTGADWTPGRGQRIDHLSEGPSFPRWEAYERLQPSLSSTAECRCGRSGAVWSHWNGAKARLCLKQT